MNAPAKFGPAARLLLAAYSAGLAAALVVTAPFWLRGLRPGGKYREGLAERLGRVPSARLRAPRPGQRAVWVHAVSVGEVLAAAGLVAQLRAALPEAIVYVSTTTRTGQAIARARFGAETVFYFPADFAFAVRAWLRFLRPSLLVLVESEFWPRLLFEARQAGIPVAVVNGRISLRSWPRYRRLRALWRPLLRTLALVHAQSATDAARLRELGASRVTVGGNLKYDLPVHEEGSPLLRLLQTHLPPGPVLVCGSTLAGEEQLLLQTLPLEPVLLLAPRHPKRFPEIAALLTKGQRPWTRLSAWRRQPAPILPGSILLLDSVGELAPLYALASVAIVGGGFLHPGGHNPLEPASLGKPVIFGCGYANFLDIVGTLRKANAVIVSDITDLARDVSNLLEKPVEATALGERARAICTAARGATARAVAELTALRQEGQAGS